MWYGLRDHIIYPRFAEDISSFLAKTLVLSTDSVISPKQKKEWQKEFINPEMCSITESLVYTDPYNRECKLNSVTEENKEFLEKEVYSDSDLKLEVAKLKEIFKSKAQSLIHGDLHCGSIFVNQNSTMVLDPEFAFYGPAGYDVGNVIAHMIFAYINGSLTMKASEEKALFLNWTLEAIKETIDLFNEKSVRLLKSDATDAMAKTDGFAEWYINDMLVDTAACTGTELIRRIVGEAKVRLIKNIENQKDKALAERIAISIGKKLIINRNNYFNGQQYVDTIVTTIKEM